MNRILITLCVALAGLSFVAADAQAGRLGGGRTSGMQRQAPPPQPAQAVPAKPAATPGTPAAGAAAVPATPPKRSWLGPMAGIAAGLGLAALMSHLGLGAEFGSLLTMVLFAVAGVFLVRFLLRRFGPGAVNRNTLSAPQGLQYAGAEFAGAPSRPASTPAFGSGGTAQGGSQTNLAMTPAVASISLPPGFDGPAFERIAKLIFIRMQAANDAGNLDDLRQFATPEMFATFRLELQDRKGMAQQTDVVQLDAQVLDFAQEADRQIVSVRFHGLIREEKEASAAPFDEVWHLVKPVDGSREWAIAGIAQTALA
ncbi:Tim44 domain-containing protein [Ideonella sp. YS5]|uniref:Tim44 domain-containing protein n=1 Tax=Ideonella sp. YS5 TaxID=3453714 RepID=UPI003EEDDAC2